MQMQISATAPNVQ